MTERVAKETKKLSSAVLPPSPAGRFGWPWQAQGAMPEVESETWPTISVVVPSFNQGTFLEETLRSLILQQYPGLEIVVMDGGSTDGSVEILRRYAPWISHWESAPDRGQSNAINRGYLRCHGDIFNWLCSDDTLLPNALWEVAARFREHPEASAVVGPSIFTDADGKPIHTLPARFDDMESLLCFWEGRAELPQPSCFVHRRAIDGLDHFLDESLHLTMDYDFWCRAFVGQAVIVTPLPLSTYRRHEAQKTWDRSWWFEKVETSRRYWGSSDCKIRRQRERSLARHRRQVQLNEDFRTFNDAAEPRRTRVAAGVHILLRRPSQFARLGAVRQWAQCLLGNETYRSARERWAQLRVAQRTLPTYVRQGRPSRVIYFGGGIGDDLMCSAICRELRQRGERRALIISKRPDLFRDNPDVAAVLPPEDRWTTGFRHLLGGRFVRPFYHKVIPPAVNYTTGGDDQYDEPEDHFIALMCRQAGIRGEVALRPYLFLSEEERATGRRFPRQACIMSQGMPVWRNKNWYVERFQQVANDLRTEVTWLQIGGSDDPRLEGTEDLRGLGFRETAAIMSHSLCFVGLAGFLMHLARAVDCPGFIVFGGRENPAISGYRENTNFYEPVPCAPCWRVYRCGHDWTCMDRITSDRVRKALAEYLDNPAPLAAAETRVLA